jgi:hypothetical protein
MHFANRRRHLFDGANFFDHELMRQKSLIDQLDCAFIPRLKPNRSEVLAADFHRV